MILSASRRTDIPAFFSDWFFNRIKDGYLMTRNPFDYYQISKITLNPKIVDCIVFWTKNPTNMIDKLDLLKEYNYYFQYTINSYNKNLEIRVPEKKYLVDTFIKLSKKIGKEKVIWRYDPIILTDTISRKYHYEYFDYLAKYLSPYTEKCVISFLDIYKKTKKNLKNINVQSISNKDMIEIATNIKNIADKYNLTIETCSEEIELNNIGIKHGKCIDDVLISKIMGKYIEVNKDKNQRDICGCVTSIDIGNYNTCQHNCLYCYANNNFRTVETNNKKHDPTSPLLLGKLTGKEKISDKKVESLKCAKYDKNLFNENL